MKKEYRKKFKARKTLTSILLKVLNNKKIEYKLEEGDECDIYNYIHSDISGMEYRRCVEDALCIEQQGDSLTPVLPYRILNSPEKTKEALEDNQTNGYRVLSKDLNRVMNRIWGIPKEDVNNFIIALETQKHKQRQIQKN